MKIFEKQLHTELTLTALSLQQQRDVERKQPLLGLEMNMDFMTVAVMSTIRIKQKSIWQRHIRTAAQHLMLL